MMHRLDGDQVWRAALIIPFQQLQQLHQDYQHQHQPHQQQEQSHQRSSRHHQSDRKNVNERSNSISDMDTVFLRLGVNGTYHQSQQNFQAQDNWYWLSRSALSSFLPRIKSPILSIIIIQYYQ